jgi:hypothetical protein
MTGFDKKFPNLIGMKCNFEKGDGINFYTEKCIEEFCLDKQIVTTEWARFLVSLNKDSDEIQKAANKFMHKLDIKLWGVRK